MELRLISLDHLVDWPEGYARTGMVLVQPHIELQLGQAGYQLPPRLHGPQLQLFHSALELAKRAFCPEVDHSHFVVLPEYALPSARFTECEALVLEHLAPNSVCIAGLDAASPETWANLLAGAVGGAEQADYARTIQHDWVNGAVIWVKDREGQLHRFLQAKLRPNPQEQRAGTVLRGSQVLYFTAGGRTFCILLCYDLIARLDEEDIAAWLWREIQADLPHPAFLFVLQDNERPDHSAFLDAARQLLTNPGNRFQVVLFVNRAGRSGQSSLLCSKEDWAPNRPDTALDDIPRLVRREAVGDAELTRLSFRYGEPAIHRFIWLPRPMLARHAGSPREPIDYAQLHTIYHGQVCSDGLSPHASQHVVAEVIDKADPRAQRPQPLSRWPDLCERLDDAYQAIRSALLRLPPGRLHAILEALLYGSHRTNPDTWQEYPELRAIRWMIEALYILQAGEVETCLDPMEQPHITADCGDFTLTIIAGDGQTRPEYLYGSLVDFYYERRPHLFLLLDHQGSSSPRAMRVDERTARRMGAGGARTPSYPLDDGPFGQQPNEERIDQTPLFWTDRRTLLELLWQAPNLPAFLRMLMEVFPWRAA